MPLYKSLLNSAWPWSRAWHAVNKEQKYFSLPDSQLVEKLFLFLVSKKKRKIVKDEFVIKSVGNIVTFVFM